MQLVYCHRKFAEKRLLNKHVNWFSYQNFGDEKLKYWLGTEILYAEKVGEHWNPFKRFT